MVFRKRHNRGEKRSYLKKHFHFIMAAIFWILMMIGFSDNWLFDVSQESNFIPKFIIHAFLAFSWFSLLLVQSALIKKRKLKLHRKLGVIAIIIIYYLMTLTIWNLYVENFLSTGALIKLFKPLELLSLVLVTLGIIYRRHPPTHKAYLIFGTFCLIGPSLDRTVFHLFGPANMFVAMVLLNLILIGLFVWYEKKIRWYMAAWSGGWIYSIGLILIKSY